MSSIPPVRDAERLAAARTDPLHLWERLQRAQRPAVELPDLLGPVPRVAQIDLSNEHALGIDAQVKRANVVQGAHEERGPNEQHDRERRLRHDEQRIHEMPTADRSRRTHLERAGDICSAAADRRGDAGEQAAQDRRDGGEDEHA
jgi:hypothetical protein